MTYQKLFPIEYNNKRFMIFLDENNRRTFLEIDAKGEYAYPILEDFLQLHKMFNHHDPFICYSVPRFTFNEKVKVLKGNAVSLLSVLIMLNNIPTALATEIEVEVNPNGVIITETVPEQIIKEQISFTNVADLNKHLGDITVTKEMVLEAIQNNSNLNEKYKRIATNLLNAILTNYPNSDLRIFYENIKTLECEEYSIEEFRKVFPNAVGAGAQYNIKLNKIISINEVPIEMLYHEMAHAFHNIYYEDDEKIVYRTETNVSANEALTNKLASLVIPIKDSYVMDGIALDYLMSLVDYDLTDFNNLGINDLMKKLSQKHPDMDFNYIISALNTMNSNLIYQGAQTRIESCEELLDDLFLFCIREARAATGYESFNKFAKLFYNTENPELVFKYLERYNEILIKLGYTNLISVEEAQNKFRIYRDATGVGYDEFETYPVIMNDTEFSRIDEKGNKTELSNISYSNFFDFPSLISSTMFSNYDIFGTNEYWTKIANENGLINPYIIEEIPVFLDGEPLGNMKMGELILRIGETKDQKIGYTLINFRTGEIVYTSDLELHNVSNDVNFSSYLYYFSKCIEKLELKDVLSEDYLKLFQKKDGVFLNLDITDGIINVEPIYKINLKRPGIMETFTLARCIVQDSDGKITIPEANISFQSDYPLLNPINLKDIFRYCNVLNSTIEQYEFSEEEVIQMVENYLKELNVERSK